MNVTYMVDEIPLKTVSYDYGDRFSTKEIPEVPQKDKYYGVWKTPEDVEITADHTIELPKCLTPQAGLAAMAFCSA